MKHHYLENEKSSVPKYIGLIILVFFVFILGWNAGINRAQMAQYEIPKNVITNPSGLSEEVNMQLFWDTWNLLNARYVDPHLLDTQEMVYGAIHGMVAAVGDPYTAFMTPKENKEFQDSLAGSLDGIGAELTLKNGVLTVVSPLKGSPAQVAGLRPEDIIYKIDGELASDMNLEQAVLKIRGPKGTQVTLTVLRRGEEEPKDIKITRQTININSVDWKMIGDYALIELNQFGNSTKDEFNKAINAILNKRPKGIVLDLRYNGGGFLDGAVDILSEFVEKGKAVTIKRRNPEEDETIYVNGKARVANTPLVVLINKGSASASEIVAGAIQDSKRGEIIGEQSFGKGTVQEVQNLIGGSSLRVTIAKWYTPLDRNITENGISPDIEVKRSAEDFESDKDPQLDAAIDWLKKNGN
jgi:carboxyl-terminal processing protease